MGVTLGEWGTSACQIYLIVFWDVWELVVAYTIGDDSRFIVVYPVIKVWVMSGTLLTSGGGA